MSETTMRRRVVDPAKKHSGTALAAALGTLISVLGAGAAVKSCGFIMTREDSKDAISNAVDAAKVELEGEIESATELLKSKETADLEHRQMRKDIEDLKTLSQRTNNNVIRIGEALRVRELQK